MVPARLNVKFVSSHWLVLVSLELSTVSQIKSLSLLEAHLLLVNLSQSVRGTLSVSSMLYCK